jgi:hypothetical protein
VFVFLARIHWRVFVCVVAAMRPSCSPVDVPAVLPCAAMQRSLLRISSVFRETLPTAALPAPLKKRFGVLHAANVGVRE